MPEYRIAVTTTGNAGSATGSAKTDNPVYGYVLGIHVNYHASAPATTDLDLTELALDQSTDRRTLLDLDDTNTDGMYYPAVEVQDSAGSGVGSYWPVFIAGRYLQVALAQCDALTNAVVVTIIMDREQ